MFEVMYHLFFGFCFVFLHFWYPMMKCDNPYAYEWWTFGYKYMYYFFAHLDWCTRSCPRSRMKRRDPICNWSFSSCDGLENRTMCLDMSYIGGSTRCRYDLVIWSAFLL